MNEESEATANLQPLSREPMRFEVLNAFRVFSEDQQLSLMDPATPENFLAAARESLQRELRKPATLYGVSAQAMFASLVASLGRVQLIKEEDQGDAYSVDTIAVPDFFIVLEDGRRLLVEVKSHYQEPPTEAFTLGPGYMEALQRYARLFGGDLYFAVYLVRWNMWMLVPAAAFEESEGQSKRLRLTMSRAARANDMRLLGDMTIGTTPPLSLVLEFDTSVPQPRTGDQILLKITADYWTSGGKRIEDPVEQRIAMYLSFYGDWELQEQEIRFEGEKLASVEMPLLPQGDMDLIREQGFAFIGSLSSMFSSYYLSLITNDEGERHRLSAKTQPGVMGRLVPEPYRGKALHLWRMVLVPGWPEGDREPEKEVAVLA